MRISGACSARLNRSARCSASSTLAAIARIQERANRGLEQTMGAEPFQRYRHMNLRPENIETGLRPVRGVPAPAAPLSSGRVMRANVRAGVRTSYS
jgi:hypothetical protein